MSVRLYRRSSKNGTQDGTAITSRSRARLLFLPASGCWSPAEELSDPVCVFPALLVSVARQPPATRASEANYVRRWAGAAADAAVLTDRSFDCRHTLPLNMNREVRQYGIENRISTP